METRSTEKITSSKWMICQISAYRRQAWWLFSQHLDLVTAASCFVVGSIVLALSYIASIGQHGLGLALLLASFTYLGIRRVMPFNGATSVRTAGLGWLAASAVAFAVVLIGAAYTGLAIPYERPLIHFILITVAYSLVLVDCLAAYRWLGAMLGLGKIILTTLTFRGIRFLTFGTLPGSDLQFHSQLAGQIADLGYVPSYEIATTKYVATPVWHTFLAAIQLLGLPKEYALFFGVVATVTVAISLLTYGLVYHITDNIQPAILAALFVSVADMFLVRTVTSITPSSFVLVYTVVILVYLTIQLRGFQHAVLFLTLFAVALTHQLSAFALLVIMGVILVVSKGASYIGTRQELSIQPMHLLFAGVIVTFVWIHVPSGETNFLGRIIERLSRTLIRMLTETNGGNGTNETYATAFSSYSVWSNLLYSLGSDLLLYLGVVGALTWLHPLYRSSMRFAYCCAALALFILIYPLTFVGLDQLLIPHRLIVFLQLFLIVFAAVIIWQLYSTITFRPIKVAVGFVIILLVFTMITAPFVNRNNPVYATDRVERTELTHAEVDGLVWAMEQQKSLYIDPRISRWIIRSEAETNDISVPEVQSYPPDLVFNDDSIIVVRSEISDRKFHSSGTFGSQERTLDGSEIQAEAQEEHRVYDNGDVVSYARR